MGRHNKLVAVTYDGKKLVRAYASRPFTCAGCSNRIPPGDYKYAKGRTNVCIGCATTGGTKFLFQR